MTLFDVAVVAVIALSALIALMRGFVREVIALGAWIAALVVAFLYAAPVAASVPRSELSPAVVQVLAFVGLFVAVLIAGALAGAALSSAVRAVGLGWVDRLLGGAFGFLRGVALVLVGVLVAGLTTLPKSDGWQRSALAPSLVAAALQFREWLPAAWSERLDFSADAPPSRGMGTRAALPRQGA